MTARPGAGIYRSAPHLVDYRQAWRVNGSALQRSKARKRHSHGWCGAIRRPTGRAPEEDPNHGPLVPWPANKVPGMFGLSGGSLLAASSTPNRYQPRLFVFGIGANVVRWLICAVDSGRHARWLNIPAWQHCVRDATAVRRTLISAEHYGSSSGRPRGASSGSPIFPIDRDPIWSAASPWVVAGYLASIARLLHARRS
jgi:hypothetical protein